MALRKTGQTKLILAILVAVLLVGSLLYFFVFKTPETSNISTDNSSQTNSNDTAKSSAANYTYITPKNWSKLSTKNLQTLKADDGIARISPEGKFTIDVTKVTPDVSTPEGLNNSVLAAIQQFSNYQLASNTKIKLSDNDAQKYIYTYGDAKTTKQILVVTIYKDQVYSLLFTTTDSSFSQLEPDFNQILSSFKFK